jgi:hypothetical protein
MVALSDYDKSRCRYVLAYGQGTPSGDRARLENAMNSIEDEFTRLRVVYHIDRCMDAIDESESDNEVAGLEYKELISGNINRSVIRYRAERTRQREEAIIFEAQMLADLLFVPNYRDPIQYQQRYYVEGGSYVMAVPGPADTCVGTRIYLSLAYS